MLDRMANFTVLMATTTVIVSISMVSSSANLLCARRYNNGRWSSVGNCDDNKNHGKVGTALKDLVEKENDTPAGPLDLIFVVDGSNSIGISSFQLIKDWLVNVTDRLHGKLGKNLRTEVLQYCNKDPAYLGLPIEKSTLFEIPYVLNDNLSIEEKANRIQSMRYLNSQTYTYYALRRANEWEFLQSEYYQKSKKMIIVVTDGEASDSPLLETWWKKYGETGIVTAIAVGVGDYIKFIDQLRMIANGRKGGERIYTIDTYSDLTTISSHLIDSIVYTYHRITET